MLKRIKRRISLLLLNPPFSCRGNVRHTASTETGKISASTAMCFLIIALSYLDTNGSAIAILPFGSMYNQRDETAWNYIRSKYRVSIIDCPPIGSFPLSSARTVIVRLSPPGNRIDQEPPLRKTLLFDWRPSVRIIRGCLPLLKSNTNSIGAALVHSTDLRNAKVHLNGHYATSLRRLIAQPAVLLPRVGQLTDGKIAVYDASTPIVLSDCVIALTTESYDDAILVRKRLVSHFPILYAQYVGTGAPFVTLQRLATTLIDLGIDVVEA